MIRSAPLRQLGAEELSHYAFCAMTTIGDEAAYRHFLPRILELAADGAADIGFEPELVAGKLVYGNWSRWRSDQRTAVTQLFNAAAQAALAYPLGDGCRIESWLAGLALLDLSFTWLLRDWRESRSLGALLQLAAFASDWAGDKREIVPVYWRDASAEAQAGMRDWLISRDTIMQLAEGLSVIRDDDRWAMALAIDRVRLRLR